MEADDTRACAHYINETGRYARVHISPQKGHYWNKSRRLRFMRRNQMSAFEIAFLLK